MPFSALKTRSRALNSILYITGSQCKDLRIGVMCSLLLVLVSTLAAAFCVACSCFIVIWGIQVKRALP